MCRAVHDVARVVNHRSEGALSKHGSGREADDDEGNDPTDDRLAENEPVDALATFEQGDTHGGANLTVRGGEGPAHTGTEDDDAGRAEFNADPTAGSQLGDLGTERVENAVTVQSKTRDDAGTTKGEDPVCVVTHGSLRADLTSLIRNNNDRERTDGVSDIISAVTEGIAARSQDLKPAHAQLRLLIELLSVGVDGIHSHVLFKNVFSLVVQRNLEVILNGVQDAHRSAENTNWVFARLSDNNLFNLFTCSALSLISLLLVVKFFGFPQDHRCDQEVRKDTGTTADAERDGASSSHRSVLQAKVRRALVNDEENVDNESGAEHDWEHNCGARKRLLRSQDESAKDDEHGERETAAHNRRQNPRDNNRGDALHVRECGSLLAPNNAIRSARDERHTDHTTDARVRGGHGHLQGGRNNEPDRDGEDDAEATVHEKNGVRLEAVLISNASLHRLNHVTSHEHGAAEFKNGGEDDGVLDGERARANGRGERVGNIVSTCVVSRR